MNSNTRVIETLSASSETFTTPFIHVDVDKVKFPNGVEGEYAVISNAQKHGAVIVPIVVRRGIGYLGLVQQYRYPVKDFTLEFPRGGADNMDAEGAEVEILEELGQPSMRLERVGTMYPDSGILSTEVGVWVAVMDESILETIHVEDITGLEPVWVSEGEFMGKLNRGEIKCGVTLAAYSFFVINRGRFGDFYL